MTQTEIVSKNIKRLMIENNLNQAELSRKTGLSEAAISRYLHATRLPSSRVISKLTKALNCSANDLFELKQENEQMISIITKMFSSLTESEKNFLISILKS